MSSYLRIDGANRVIEVGHLMFSPVLQRSPASTEAMYLMARYAFEELGYRRYEWKCHSLNAPSNRAAKRLALKPWSIDPHHPPPLIKRSTSDTSLFMKKVLSHASSLGDDSRWENQHGQVNSRFRSRIEKARLSLYLRVGL